jgi:hypothetical protein
LIAEEIPTGLARTSIGNSGEFQQHNKTRRENPYQPFGYNGSLGKVSSKSRDQ